MSFKHIVLTAFGWLLGALLGLHFHEELRSENRTFWAVVSLLAFMALGTWVGYHYGPRAWYWVSTR